MSRSLDLELGKLDDYVRGNMADAGLDAYEADLFERALAGTAPELGLRAGLERSLREMKARGTIAVWITRAQVDALGDQGLKIAHYELDLANPTEPVIAADADLFVARIRVDLAGVERIEAELLADDGRVLKVMPDIQFDPAEGAIFACCEAELARLATSAPQRTTRFWATAAGAERRLLLEVQGT